MIDICHSQLAAFLVRLAQLADAELTRPVVYKLCLLTAIHANWNCYQQVVSSAEGKECTNRQRFQRHSEYERSYQDDTCKYDLIQCYLIHNF